MGGTLSQLRIILCCIRFALYYYYYVESGLCSVHLLVCDTSLYMIAIEQTSNSNSWHHTIKLHVIFIQILYLTNLYLHVNRNTPYYLYQFILFVSLYALCIIILYCHFIMTVCFSGAYIVQPIVCS